MTKVVLLTLLAFSMLMNVFSAVNIPDTTTYLRSWHEDNRPINEVCFGRFCGDPTSPHPTVRHLISDYQYYYNSGIVETQLVTEIQGPYNDMLQSRVDTKLSTVPGHNPANDRTCVMIYNPVNFDSNYWCTTVTLPIFTEAQEFGTLAKTDYYPFPGSFTDNITKTTTSKYVLRYANGTAGYSYDYLVYARVMLWAYDWQTGLLTSGGYVTGVKIGGKTATPVNYLNESGWYVVTITVGAGTKELDITPSVTTGGSYFYTYEIGGPEFNGWH